MSVDSTDLDIADLVSAGVGGEFLEAYGLVLETEKDREALNRENGCWCLFSVLAAIAYCSPHNKQLCEHPPQH